MMSKVSVIIPAYNAAGFIENCIRSIQEQTYQNFEIIVVNDGSKDTTLDILKRLAKDDSRIIIIDQKNGGVSVARNTALVRATGEYLTMVDADDDIPSNALKNMVDLMREDVDLVIGSHMQVRLGKKPYIEPNVEFRKDEINDNFRTIDPKIWFPWAKLFRRSVVADNNILYDTNISYGEDHIFNLSFIKNMTGRIICTDTIVYNYYFIRGGLCAKYYPNMHELQKYVLNCIVNYFGGKENFPENYMRHYTGCYLLGCFDYYIAWCGKSEAIKKVEESLNMYDDMMNDKIWKEFFSQKQLKFIEEKDYAALVRDYTKHNPKKTILRKYKRKVRQVLEYFLEIRIKIGAIKYAGKVIS